MKHRDPISNTFFYASSLMKDPVRTLEDTWKGMRRNDELGVVSQFAVPAMAPLGATLAFMGAATLNPVAVGIGVITVGDAAGRYLELGHSPSRDSEAAKDRGLQIPPPAFTPKPPGDIHIG